MNSGMQVSVIIPTCNRPKELLRALKSVVNQTLNNIEVVVVDDSESQNAKREVAPLIRDARVMFIRNMRKKGANGARNTGITETRGKYLAFLDDDDEWYKTKLENQVSKLERLDSTWGGIYGAYDIYKRGRWRRRRSRAEGNLLFESLYGSSPVCAGSTLLIRRETIAEVGLFDEDLQRHQDLEFLARFFSRYKLATIAEPVSKIYGHNPPESLQAEQGKLQFFEKLAPHIETLELSKKNEIYAVHYRELCSLFSKQGHFRKAFEYLGKTLRLNALPVAKSIRPVLYLFSSVFSRFSTFVKKQINNVTR